MSDESKAKSYGIDQDMLKWTNRFGGGIACEFNLPAWKQAELEARRAADKARQLAAAQKTFTPDEVERFAVAMATMEGKKQRFLDDKAGRLDLNDGTYQGFLAEAGGMLCMVYGDDCLLRAQSKGIDPDLEEAIRAAWSAETSTAGAQWSAKNPARGQCAVTALLIQKMLGGVILRNDAVTIDGVRESHWLNILEDGEFDMTFSQFPEGTKLIPKSYLKDFAEASTYAFSNPDTLRRFNALEAHVIHHLTSK